jgi:hypothetical protein
MTGTIWVSFCIIGKAAMPNADFTPAACCYGAGAHDVARAARRMPDRTGKTPGDPLKIGKDTEASLVAQSQQRAGEVIVVDHEPVFLIRRRWSLRQSAWL